MNIVFRIVLFAAASTLVVTGNEEDNLILLSPIVTISRASKEPQCTPGIIYGARPCDTEPGNATVQQWTYQGCSPSRIGPTGNCEIPCDSTYRWNIFTFVPNEDIPGELGIRFKISAIDVALRVYELLIPDSVVKAGEAYTVRTSGSPKEGFRGRVMRFRQMIFKQADDSIVACREADFDNV